MRIYRIVSLYAVCISGFLAFSEPAFHVLEKGETLYSIARKYKVPVALITDANGITDVSKLKIGQRILIPETYEVAKGDTLFGIARKFAVSVEELRSLNKLSPDALLRAGSVLLIPAKPPQSGSAGPAPSPPDPSKGGKDSPQSAQASPGPTSAAPPISAPEAASQDALLGSSLLPPPLKTSQRPVDASVSWPCAGELVYMDGKLFGVMIRAEKGSVIKSVISGTVVSVGPYRGFSQVLFAQSKTGHIYVYGGMEASNLKIGDPLRSGQELGTVAFDPKEGRPLAYFFVFKDGSAVDPALAPR